MTLPFFLGNDPVPGREEIAQVALFPVGEQAFVMLALQRGNEVARTARLVFQKEARERVGKIEKFGVVDFAGFTIQVSMEFLEDRGVLLQGAAL